MKGSGGVNKRTVHVFDASCKDKYSVLSKIKTGLKEQTCVSRLSRTRLTSAPDLQNHITHLLTENLWWPRRNKMHASYQLHVYCVGKGGNEHLQV